MIATQPETESDYLSNYTGWKLPKYLLGFTFSREKIFTMLYYIARLFWWMIMIDILQCVQQNYSSVDTIRSAVRGKILPNTSDSSRIWSKFRNSYWSRTFAKSLALKLSADVQCLEHIEMNTCAQSYREMVYDSSGLKHPVVSPVTWINNLQTCSLYIWLLLVLLHAVEWIFCLC